MRSLFVLLFLLLLSACASKLFEQSAKPSIGLIDSTPAARASEISPARIAWAMLVVQV